MHPKPPRIALIAIGILAHDSCYAQAPATPVTYYVSNTGIDTNLGTSPETAWRTLAKVSDADANQRFRGGDSILLERGGVWNETLTLTSSGASHARITLSHYGPGTLPPAISRSNVAGWPTCLELKGSHWAIGGLHFEHAHLGIHCQSPPAPPNDPTPQRRDVEINGCSFRNIDNRTDFTNISTGVYLTGGGWRDVTIRCCRFDRVSAGVFNFASVNSTNLVIDQCEAFGGWAAGFGLMNVSNSTISNSRVHDVGGLNPVGSTACYLNSCTNVIVTNCSISGCKHGGGPDGCGVDFEASNTNCVLANSVIFDNEGPAVMVLTGSNNPNYVNSDIIIANCLFYNNNTVPHNYSQNQDADATLFQAGSPASTGTISNCGIYKNSTPGTLAFGGNWSGFSQSGTLIGSYCQGWTPVYGQFTHLSVGGNGYIAAVDQNGIVKMWNGQATGNCWAAVGGLSNAWRATIGNDGELWAIDTSSRPWRYSGNSIWTTATQWPSLTNVSAGSAANIWGVNDAGAVFRFTAGSWQTQAAPLLSDIDAGPDSGDVWGLRGTNVHRRAANIWAQVTNLSLTQISLHKMNVQVSGGPSPQYNDIVAGVSGTTIKRSVKATNYLEWKTLPGSLVQVSEGSDGTLWGRDANGFVWRY